MNPVDQGRLQREIDLHFNLDEFRNLCFTLHIDYDNLPGETKSARIRELILFMLRQHRIPELIQVVQHERPHLQLLTNLTSDTTRGHTIQLSRQEASEKINKWIQRRFWLPRSLIAEWDKSPDLNHCYWPIALFEGECRVEYSTIQRRREYGRLGKGLTDLTKLKPGDFERVEKASGKLKISRIVATPGDFPVDKPELLELFLNLASESSPRIKTDWLPLNFCIIATLKLMVFLKLLAKHFISEGTAPIWPDIAPSKKLVKLVPFKKSISLAQSHDKTADPFILQLQDDMKVRLKDAVRKTKHGQWLDVNFLSISFTATTYPFWVLESQVAENSFVMIMNAYNGKIVFVQSPINRVAKIVITITLVLFLLSILYVLLFSW
jgi:hypothetical protein